MIMVNCFGVCFVISSALFLQKNNNIYNKLTMLNPTCFFLFGLHILLVNSCLSVIYKIFPHVSVVLLFIAAVTMNTLLCIVSYYIVRIVSPSIASILSGGRQ